MKEDNDFSATFYALQTTFLTHSDTLIKEWLKKEEIKRQIRKETISIIGDIISIIK